MRFTHRLIMGENFISLGYLFHVIVFILPPSGGQISFTSKYQGKTVTGLAGSSVNFTWSFSGDVDSIAWGLKEDGINDFENNGILATLDKSGPVSGVTVPSAYKGRVSGSGHVSSGHVIFTLRSIRTGDEKFYGCRIQPTDSFKQERFDLVYLAVKVMNLPLGSTYVR